MLRPCHCPVAVLRSVPCHISRVVSEREREKEREVIVENEKREEKREEEREGEREEREEFDKSLSCGSVCKRKFRFCSHSCASVCHPGPCPLQVLFFFSFFVSLSFLFLSLFFPFSLFFSDYALSFHRTNVTK